MSENPEYSRYSIGKWTYGFPVIQFPDDGANLRIGKYCSIADGVTILLGGEHRIDWLSTYPFSVLWKSAKGFVGHPKQKGDVVIGNDVWIGKNALILSGVKIGNGAVIGASCVVTRNVPPYTVVAGNPARVVKERFAPVHCEALERIAWWNWTDEKVQQALPLLLSGNVDQFITAHDQPVSRTEECAEQR